MHLDRDSCMEVTVLKGRSSEVQELANHIIAERGVRPRPCRLSAGRSRSQSRPAQQSPSRRRGWPSLTCHSSRLRRCTA
ncbi:MAG TPA: hypothetical protein VHX43_13925 [Xanthobacteraceae bacterium]|nr:hypothetical protein [Xanthobacteraceae bacterium]